MKRLLLAAAVAAALAVPTAAWADSSHAKKVVVPRGRPVQFAFTADTTQPEFPVFAPFTTSAENAIQMAIEQHPRIRVFPIEVN